MILGAFRFRLFQEHSEKDFFQKGLPFQKPPPKHSTALEQKISRNLNSPWLGIFPIRCARSRQNLPKASKMSPESFENRTSDGFCQKLRKSSSKKSAARLEALCVRCFDRHSVRFFWLPVECALPLVRRRPFQTNGSADGGRLHIPPEVGGARRTAFEGQNLARD